MRVLFIIILTCLSGQVFSQMPCSGPEYRKLDFWIGDWEVFGKNGKKAGDSRITLILDSCVILEEWTSANLFKGLRYSGKSFNSYNAATGQWQQTWVDNTGTPIEFLKGRPGNDEIVFSTIPVVINSDTTLVKRMTFSKISNDKVRQHAELSYNNGVTWNTNVDLEYRRRR